MAQKKIAKKTSPASKPADEPPKEPLGIVDNSTILHAIQELVVAVNGVKSDIQTIKFNIQQTALMRR